MRSAGVPGLAVELRALPKPFCYFGFWACTGHRLGQLRLLYHDKSPAIRVFNGTVWLRNIPPTLQIGFLRLRIHIGQISCKGFTKWIDMQHVKRVYRLDQRYRCVVQSNDRVQGVNQHTPEIPRFRLRPSSSRVLGCVTTFFDMDLPLLHWDFEFSCLG
jgi:hypothetical protein